MSYNMEYGESHDPVAGDRALAAEQAEANRMYWAARVPELQAQIARKNAEVEELRVQLLEAEAHRMAAGPPVGNY
jgi:hypothetical protein